MFGLRHSLCTTSYIAKRTSEPLSHPEAIWCALLPALWRPMAVTPVVFDLQRDYEVAAERLRGEDEAGKCCFRSYRYLAHDMRSDDDEDYYMAVTYGISLTAWLLRDGRWLSRRLSSDGSESGRVFFVLGESDPGASMQAERATRFDSLL